MSEIGEAGDVVREIYESGMWWMRYMRRECDEGGRSGR